MFLKVWSPLIYACLITHFHYVKFYLLLLKFVSDSLWPHGLQHAWLLFLPLSLGICSNQCPLSQRCYLTISLCHPLLLLPSIFPSIRVFSNESTLCIRAPKYWSFSLSISLSNEYSELLSLELSGLISLHPRDSQESSPAPQFKNINSSEGLLNTNYSQGNHQIKIIAFIYWEGILYQPFSSLGWIVVQDEGTFWMSVFSPGFYAC